MISQCANPACGIPFYYLRGGCLYRFDIKSPCLPCKDVPNAVCSLKPSHAAIFFWLCEQCSAQYSLRFEFRDGLTLVPLSHSQCPARHAPVVAVEKTLPISDEC